MFSIRRHNSILAIILYKAVDIHRSQKIRFMKIRWLSGERKKFLGWCPDCYTRNPKF